MKVCYSWRDRCECNFNKVGYAVGWLGAIYRTLAIVRLAIFMTKLSEDENVYLTLSAILLAYGFVSLAANFLFVVGKNHNYLVPYLGIYGIEISAAISILVGGIILVVKVQKTSILEYLIPTGLLFVSVYSFLWWLLLRLYQDFRNVNEENNASIHSVGSDFRYVTCSWNCFKSDSLDIVT